MTDVSLVIEKINMLLASEGSRLTLLDSRGDEVTVRFDRGGQADCESCAIDPDTVEMLLREAITRESRTIRNVKIVTDQEG
ncbi:MAG TPA: NifU family protein [Amaricoccus sp.]|uniref:hypothetical protein n=1 Tax=Amaricoccus sp. TaxID=1872485 RepID=UPI002C6CFD3D|nr:hypothetical protein [Amaricoccus sp.]HMR34230.1 NifU family protein [Geminicoccus sp.]HMU00776.1 NifU family protein [Amaricoccus sp.]